MFCHNYDGIFFCWVKVCDEVLRNSLASSLPVKRQNIWFLNNEKKTTKSREKSYLNFKFKTRKNFLLKNAFCLLRLEFKYTLFCALSLKFNIFRRWFQLHESIIYKFGDYFVRLPLLLHQENVLEKQHSPLSPLSQTISQKNAIFQRWNTVWFYFNLFIWLKLLCAVVLCGWLLNEHFCREKSVWHYSDTCELMTLYGVEGKKKNRLIYSRWRSHSDKKYVYFLFAFVIFQESIFSWRLLIGC